MGIFTKLARDIFAPFSASGQPRQVDNGEAVVWGTEVERMVGSVLGNGGLIYDTQASLFSDLSHSANRSAWVVADTVVTNNGIYRKLGGAGSGSWTRLADLPYSFIRLTDAGVGTVNAIIATSAMPLPGSDSAALLVMNVTEPNSGPVTVAANGGAPKPLLTASGAELAPGYLVASMMICFLDEGASFRLLSDVSSAAIQVIATAAAASALASEENAAASEAVAVAGALAAKTSVGALPYLFSTATADADPGPGAFRLNHATPGSATAAYIDNADGDGIVATGVLDTWDDSTNTVRGTLTIRSQADATIRHTFGVTGAVVAGAGYRKLTLAYSGGAGALADGVPCWLIFSRAGDAGEVTLGGAQTLTNKTLTSPTVTSPTLTLKQSAAPTPTTEGAVEWDLDDNVIVVGDGAGQRIFAALPAGAAAGDLLYLSSEKALARLAKGAALQGLRINAGAAAPEWADQIFSKEYVSGEQTITAAGALNLAHGLGTIPKHVQPFLLCKVAEVGYSVGDVVPINPALNTAGTWAIGLSIALTSSAIRVRFGAHAVVITVINHATGAYENITPTNWRLVLRALA